jgi:hypothetical protein
MTRRLSLALAGLTGLAGLFAFHSRDARAQPTPAMQWVWFDEGDPRSSAW